MPRAAGYEYGRPYQQSTRPRHFVFNGSAEPSLGRELHAALNMLDEQGWVVVCSLGIDALILRRPRQQ